MAAVLFVVAGASTVAPAAVPALQGQVLLRPLTPQEIKDYSLTNAEGASGLSTIGKGQPAYLDALVNNAISDSDITNVTWTLTAKPSLSAATLDPSPLGANVPTYRMADRINQSGAAVYKIAGPNGRAMLRPDLTGLYTVSVTIQTATSGSTNLTQNITAGTYMGVATCALCHSGGVIAPDKFGTWSQTPHASFFARAIDGLESSHYGPNCISCHTVGYDTNTNAVNGGFDDIAARDGWTFPTVLTNGNWASMVTNYPHVANLANIQCENCHGAGSEHALGELLHPQSPEAKAAISVTFDAGNCAQCHDSTPNHFRSAEWNNSIHARPTRTPTGGANRAACARCHTGGGFADYADSLDTNEPYSIVGADTTYTSITCATCHDPHDASKPHQLRTSPVVTLADDVTVVTNAGSGALCMNCHRSRNGPAENSIIKYPVGLQTWAGGTSFGPHDNPASDMLEGVNGWTYGKNIPSSAHRNSVTNTCVGCHMQSVASTDAGFTKAGGHTWNMSYQTVSGGVTNTVDLVNVCVQCHGPIDSFDMVKVDYNGDGIIEGVQTEVQHLLDRLSTMLPSSTYQASGNYIADGLVKSNVSPKTNWPTQFLEAGYNFQFVRNDLSKGVHNTAYAVGLLKASIADLTGDGNEDGLPDAWQVQYFGSTTAANASPNATPAGDGVPNWLKWSLGLNPLVAGVAVPDGVIWANADAVGGDTNTIHVYTAAEIAFDTQAGTTYQIQAVSSLGGGWQNVGTPIPGTGESISYVTPTRSNAQQFYRVIHTP